MAISRIDRAKQFMPFDALKGLKEALKNKELEYEDRKYLAEDEEEKISKILYYLEINNIIKVKYYNNRQYIKFEGKIKRIDPIKKKLIFFDNTIIQFDDIVDIRKL